MKLFVSLNKVLDRLPRGLIVAISLLLLLIISALDYFTGEEIGFSIFYVIPVMIMAWYLGRTASIIMSFVAAAAWYIADTAAEHVYSHAAIPIWNALVHLGFLLLIGLFMSILKDVLGREQDLARMDSLTGVVNTRHFYELAEVELARAKRYGHALSVAYMDLDNFKEVNDIYGHSVGDELLCFIAGTMRDNIRSSDVIARLGGDEFALLLPETKEGDADKVMEKLYSIIKEGMPQYHFPVTLSVGLLTYIALPDSVEDMIRDVDNLMYSVKKSSKNAIKHAVIEDKRIVGG